jgi:NAD(P)-dependent dehydrogenase (short-subunit alcohol dehydrogenase family)
MVTRAAATALAGEGQQVVVVAVGALSTEKAAGEVAAAQALAQGGFAGRIKWPEVFEAI